MYYFIVIIERKYLIIEAYINSSNIDFGTSSYNLESSRSIVHFPGILTSICAGM